MKVSLVTIVKRSTGQLRKLISHLERCDPLPEELIVVWMDPPTEDSLAVSQRFKIVHKFLNSYESWPIAKARNKGIRVAANPIVGYLSVDALPARSFIEDHGKLCSPGSIVVSESYYEMAAETLQNDSESASESPSVEKSGTEFLDLNDFATLFFIHQEDFKKVGGFDERFHGFGINDEDFFTQCFQTGVELKRASSQTPYQQRAKYDCPLNHLLDYSRNAQLFCDKWGFFPNKNVLSEYVKYGCINADFEQVGIKIKRLPTPEEIGKQSTEP